MQILLPTASPLVIRENASAFKNEGTKFFSQLGFMLMPKAVTYLGALSHHLSILKAQVQTRGKSSVPARHIFR